MERQDLALIDRLEPEHPELAQLMERHRGYERELAPLSHARWLSSAEEAEQRRLKRLKLVGRDRIESILSAHRGCRTEA